MTALIVDLMKLGGEPPWYRPFRRARWRRQWRHTVMAHLGVWMLRTGLSVSSDGQIDTVSEAVN